ncbi:MAG: hypothetical protein AAF587_30430 [Bacteroidota bacterium]
MFRTIFQFELSYWMRNPLLYGFSIILFGLSFLTMWGMSAEAHIGDNIVMMNSYYKINNMANMFALLLIFLLPAIIGHSVFRDYSSRFYTVFYSFPFTKTHYLGAKFLSAFCVVAIIVCLLTAGFMLGSIMPGVKDAAMLPFDILNYLHLILLFLLPNMLFFGSVVWALTLATRNMYISFIGVILMVIVQYFAKGVLGSSGLDLWAAVSDPTGDAAVAYVARYWTLEERNMNSLPISGVILYNRLFWLLISVLILGWSFLRFEFHQFASVKKSRKKATTDQPIPLRKVPQISLPDVAKDYSFANQLRTTWHLSAVNFRAIVFSWPFASILLAGGLLVLFQQYQMGPQEGVVSIPTTANMLRFPMFFFSAIVNLLTFLYAGVLVHKDRLYRMNSFVDISPQADWVSLLSKLLSLLKMQLVLLSLVMIGGIIAQLLAGYYRLEIGHYLFELYLLQGIHFFAWACLALSIHTVFKRMYWGYFVLILIPLGNIVLPSLGDYLGMNLLKEPLLQFNTVRDIFLGFDYSDFHGYGSQLTTYFSYKLYWFFCSILLLIIGLLFWVRGLSFRWQERWTLARSRYRGGFSYSLLIALVLFIGTGGFIYYQEHVVSKVFFSEQEMEAISAKNEQQYGQLEGMVQPILSDVKMTMDIYPETQDFVASGTFTYINKAESVIDTIILAKSFKEQTSCSIRQAHQLLMQDEYLQYEVIQLDKGLEQGDSLHIFLEVSNYPNNFLHHNSRVIANGTYLTHHILPRLGFKDILLRNQKARKKHGLPSREFSEQLPEDSSLLGYDNPANNMGLITYECVISTSLDQQALTMGKLKRSWQKNRRNYAHFQSDGPIVNTLSWLSGIYEEKSYSGPDQEVKLYRHPLQGKNDVHFFHGLRSSLAYCSTWFGPLKYDTIRVVEFPITEGTYATVHGNLMPYSESYFTCDIADEENAVFNMPFFVSAHEVAHCWWGHRLDPANVAGGRMITEGLANYIAMKATETAYDKELVLNLRKEYHEMYLEERARQSNETPLVHSSLENEFLNYRKASLAIYAMSEFLGETVYNQALAQFEESFRHTEPPFASALDFIAYMKSATPDSLQYLIHDLFETITLYDNRLNEVRLVESNGSYTTQLVLTASKYRADSKGKRSYGTAPLQTGDLQSLPLADYLDVGLYDEQDRLIEWKRVLVTNMTNTYSWTTSQAVHKVQIDPHYLLFDVNRSDDLWERDN